MLKEEIIQALGSVVGNLYDRWQDEKEYEDWTEYVAVMRGAVESRGYKFHKAGKRPFGITLIADDTLHRISATETAIKHESQIL